jgi:ribosomal protein S27AE
MDYLKHYNLLIESRRTLVRDVYTENHHIIPKCYGGTDDPSNIVALTAREHFVAHWLLWRANRDRKSSAMFNAMCRASKGQERYKSSRGYQEARESQRITKKGIPLSEEHKAKIKANNARTGKPNWNSGKTFKKEKVKCSKCGDMVSADHHRRWHEQNCQLEEYKKLLNLHTRKEILILKNISNQKLQYWVSKIKKRYGNTHST